MSKLKKFAGLILILFLLGSASYALSAPVNLAARAEPGMVSLNWSPAAGAVSYNVYRKEATDPAYSRINFSPVSGSSYEDRTVGRGRDYLYAVRAVASDGSEGPDSAGVGAPLMSIKTTSSLTTLRSKPIEAKSIRTGKMVTFAAPGDLITYHIAYANNGYSSARNVKIDYDIPNGTVIAGVPNVKELKSVVMSYFDNVKKRWMAKIENERNISRVRFLVNGDVRPEVSGMIDLNVEITL